MREGAAANVVLSVCVLDSEWKLVVFSLTFVRSESCRVWLLPLRSFIFCSASHASPQVISGLLVVLFIVAAIGVFGHVLPYVCSHTKRGKEGEEVFSGCFCCLAL